VSTDNFKGNRNIFLKLLIYGVSPKLNIESKFDVIYPIILEHQFIHQYETTDTLYSYFMDVWGTVIDCSPHIHEITVLLPNAFNK